MCDSVAVHSYWKQQAKNSVMNIYFWMKDDVTDRGKAACFAQLRATTFLLGHWFEIKRDTVLGSEDVYIKSAKLHTASKELDIRIVSITQVEHLSFADFIHLWNWSSTLYKHLYALPDAQKHDQFAIDLYDDDDNPYEVHLGKVRAFNFSSMYDDLRADFRATASLLGKSLMEIQDPDGEISIESLLSND